MPEVPVVMPKMSMTMTEGEVVGWRRQQGEAVRSGEVLLEVMTDKVEMEVEAPADGVLQRVVAAEGDRVPVGEPLAYITAETDALLGGLFDSPPPAHDGAQRNGTSDGASDGAQRNGDGAASAGAAEDRANDGAQRNGAAVVVASPPPDSQLRPVPPSRRSGVPALPGARRRASGLGVDLASVVGTGPDGAVSVRDVEAAHATPSVPSRADAVAAPAPAPPPEAAPVTAPAAPAAPAPAPARPSAGDVGFADALAGRRAQIRAAVNAVMEQSTSVPQFTAWARLDLDAADRDRGRLSWTTLLLSALARGLREAGSADAGVGLALAVDTPVGLLAPVIADCDRDDLPALDAAMRAAIDRARRGRLGAGDVDDAVSTLSNLGGWGVDRFQALLTPPQASALSVGVVGHRPVVRHGALGVSLVCEVGLTVDHRVYDGADAARILQAVQSALVHGHRGAPAAAGAR